MLEKQHLVKVLGLSMIGMNTLQKLIMMIMMTMMTATRANQVRLKQAKTSSHHHLSVRPQQHLALPRQKLQLRKKPTGSWVLTDTGGITIRKPMNGGIRTKTARLLNSTDGV